MKKQIALLILLLSSIGGYPQTVYISADGSPLLGTPSREGKPMVTLMRGTKAEIVKQTDVWFLIQSTDYIGWIHSTDLTTGPPDIKAATLITPVPSYTPGRSYIRGPRGGCYYINSNGNKTYVSRGLCG